MWDLIAEDVVRAVQYFFRHSFIPFGLNSNFLVLIPKVDGVVRIKDCKPIVLGNFLFKVFTKILATRLGPVVTKLLSPHQFRFVPGKSIHNCILYASEGNNCLDNTSVQGNVAIKVDIRKAFDTVSCDFLLGDPLSPLRFCIAEDVLARLIDRAVSCGDFHLAFALNKFFCPTYLLYADDVLVFCKASRRNARCLKHILDTYAGLSGQVFNPKKSKAYFGKNVSAQNIGSVALPFTYLGVPLFIGTPKAAHLRDMADRIISKFAGWKGSALSLANRACLVNSVIVSSLVHSMMIYRWPRPLLNKIDRVMRNFIWTGSSMMSSFCTVN
ncbi:hypothetical protein ACS0TY_017570 [Phlomoides rotata]